MLQKIFIKVSLLFISLALVYAAMNFFSSAEFKKEIATFFQNAPKAYSWCPEHAIDFEWLDSSISEKWKSAKASDIQSRFCKLTLEPIKNIDLSKIRFRPLLKVQSAEAKTSQLEWDSEAGVFQVNGLPFYSTSLHREILDK